MSDQSNVVTIADAIRDVIDAVEEKFKYKDGSSSLSTGFYDLDRKLSGFGLGQLIVIGARPWMGRSIFALNIAQHVAMDDGKAVGIFSLGESSTNIAEKLLCSVSGMSRMKFHSGRLENEDWPLLTDGMKKLQGCPFAINDKHCLTMIDIVKEVDSMSSTLNQKLSLVVIDGLEEIQPTELQSSWSRKKFSRYVLETMKKLAVEQSLVVLTVTGLKSKIEKRKFKQPLLSDLKGKSCIAQNADCILFLNRPGVYEPRKDKGIAEVYVAKHSRAINGLVKLSFSDKYNQFKDLSFHQQP